MKNKIFGCMLAGAITLGTATWSEEATEESSFWSNLATNTVSSAGTMWKVTKNGSVTAWKATKSGSGIVWEKTKSGSESACKYRPSNLIGGVGAGAAATAGAATAAVGLGTQAAGFYTLTNAVTGLTMLGSTAGGVSAAGTVGIMGGTAGVIGTTASIIMAPATIIAGAAVAGVTFAFEGVCYFSIETLKDPALIMEILENLASHSDKEYFELIKNKDGTASIYVATEVELNGKVMERTKYSVSDLYIEDGIIKNSDWGPNSKIGKVGYASGELVEQ